MPKFISLLLLQLSCCALFAQHISVANEAQNIFYIGVDNPLSIAVENLSDKQLVVKTNNGKIVKEENGYVYRGGNVGTADIILYKKVNGKFSEVGRSTFRVKNIPPPTFRIGPYGTNRLVKKIIIQSQQYVRAEWENIDINAHFAVDSFKVCIVLGDTCQYTVKTNIGNKISEELTAAFHALKPGDTIIFKDIFAKGPDGIQIQLEPCILFVKEE